MSDNGYMTPRPGSFGGGARLSGWQWLLVNRQTGRVSIAQWPNLPLWVWIAVSVAQRVLPLHGRADAALGGIGTVALVVWAVDELWRGVNPWRRLLGLGVLVSTALAALH